MIHFKLNHKSGIPLYKQLLDQIQIAIFTGQLTPQEPLPSVRELSKELKISPLTIAKAYLELEHQKLVVTRWGKGTFVAEKRSPLKKSLREKHLQEAIDRFISDALPLVKDPQMLPKLITQRL